MNNDGGQLYRISDIRLVLVDHDCMMREGLAALFEREPGVEVVGSSDGGSAALDLVDQLRPNLVVVNVSPGKTEGMEAIRSIAQKSVGTKIIALSALCNRTIVAKAFRAGADAYVVKHNGFSELVRAIDRVLSGETHLCSHAYNVVIEQFRNPTDDKNKPILTDREYVVLQRIGEGQTSKEIALQMDLSSKTIDACRRQLMHKLGVDNVAGLVKHAILMGLTATSP